MIPATSTARAGQATPGRRPPARAITAGLVATVLVTLAGLVLTALEWSSLATSDAIDNIGGEAGAIAYAALGALIVRRAGNLVGWFMLAEGAATAVMTTGSAYAIFGVKAHPGTLPAAAAVGALAETVFVLVVAGLTAIFLVFPSGRLPSPRWRPAVTAGLVLTGLSLASFIVSTRQVALPAPGGISLTYPNPLAVEALRPFARLGTLGGLAVLILLLLGSAVVSLALRYRRGDQRLRQQMKWLGLAFAGVLACQAVGGLSIAAGQENKPLQQVPYAITPFLVYLAIPGAMAIAILRRRLFDIDVIISRALLVTLLSAGVTAVYAGIVFGIGTLVGSGSDPLLTIAAAVAVALVFQPLRQRASRLANRLVYGERTTPYQVLSDFAGDMAGQLDLTEAVDRMVSVLAGATGADRAEAWIRVGPELRPAAIWPRGSLPSAAVTIGAGDSLPPFAAASRAVAVSQAGELLGALSLHKPPNEPLTSTEDELMRHLASQAGLVLRNAALTAELQATIDELRASRRRLVEAQDAERRKIERNLHDGAQQQLIALTIHLGLLEESAADPAAVTELVGAVKNGVRAALDDLRDLARGIYPPLLADQGLIPALQAQVRKASIPVEIDADGIGRYPQDTEAAVYFCTLEALQNITKYASASRAKVGLSCSDDCLRFTVTDNGTGFDTATTRHGTGLQGMADRLAALGGALQVRSQPGHGTILRGELPLAAPGHGLRRDISAGPHAAGAPRGLPHMKHDSALDGMRQSLRLAG